MFHAKIKPLGECARMRHWWIPCQKYKAPKYKTKSIADLPSGRVGPEPSPTGGLYVRAGGGLDI